MIRLFIFLQVGEKKTEQCLLICLYGLCERFSDYALVCCYETVAGLIWCILVFKVYSYLFVSNHYFGYVLNLFISWHCDAIYTALVPWPA